MTVSDFRNKAQARIEVGQIKAQVRITLPPGRQRAEDVTVTVVDDEKKIRWAFVSRPGLNAENTTLLGFH